MASKRPSEPEAAPSLSSMENLQRVEQRIIDAVKCAGNVMQLLGQSGPSAPVGGGSGGGGGPSHPHLPGNVHGSIAAGGGPGGANRKPEMVAGMCQDFMLAMRDVQVIMRNEIRIMCEYRSYENSDYMERLLAELSAEKLDCLGNRIQHLQQILGNDGDDEENEEVDDGAGGYKAGGGDGDAEKHSTSDGTGNEKTGMDELPGSVSGEGQEKAGENEEEKDQETGRLEDDIGLPSMFLSMLPVAREESPE